LGNDCIKEKIIFENTLADLSQKVGFLVLFGSLTIEEVFN